MENCYHFHDEFNFYSSSITNWLTIYLPMIVSGMTIYIYIYIYIYSILYIYNIIFTLCMYYMIIAIKVFNHLIIRSLPPD